MQTIEQALSLLRRTPGCSVLPPSGIPRLPVGLSLPTDVRDFYAVAGGASIFENSNYPFFIAKPATLISTNELVVGERFPEDISDTWFSIADDGNGDFLSIDLHPTRAGRCYDSFHETHGVAGSTPVIANSFTELLFELIKCRGERLYWTSSDFVPLGDAYDPVQ